MILMVPITLDLDLPDKKGLLERTFVAVSDHDAHMLLDGLS